MKKRVLHVLASNKYSGAENVACTIINNDKKYDMFYCSPNGPISYELKKRNVKFIPLKRFNSFEINKICKQYNIDIIHAHDMKASFIVAFAKKKIKKISSLHTQYDFNSKWTIYSMAYNKIIKKFHKIICDAKEIYDKSIFINDKTKDKFVVIPNVINKERALKESLKFKTKKYDMVFVGRITEVKRPDWVIDITKEIVKKYPKFKVAMIGSGNLDETIKNMISEYNLGKNIDFLGFQSNPYPYIKNSKFAISTSIHEGLPMVVIESMSLKIPVLNTGVDGLGVLFKDNKEFICETKEEFVKKIYMILDNRLDLSRKCIDIVKESIDIDNYIRKINVLYK